MEPRAVKELAAGQGGSITVMTALLMPTLVLMIFLVVDIGQLIFEKVRLQNVADACAYSAATVQAAGLNEIADLNLSAELELAKLLAILAKTFSTPFKDVSDGQNTVRFYQKVFDNIRSYQDDANKDYARKALDVARRVKKTNLDDKGIKGVTLRSLNPKSTEGSPGKLMEYRRESLPVAYLFWLPVPCFPFPCMRQATAWQDMLAGDARYEGRHDGTLPATLNSVGQAPGMGTVRYKIVKRSSPTTYSAFELSHAPHDLVLAPSVFGRTETLKAYAAAMPTTGQVEWGVPLYRAVMVRLNALNPKPKADNLGKVLH